MKVSRDVTCSTFLFGYKTLNKMHDIHTLPFTKEHYQSEICFAMAGQQEQVVYSYWPDTIANINYLIIMRHILTYDSKYKNLYHVYVDGNMQKVYNT